MKALAVLFVALALFGCAGRRPPAPPQAALTPPSAWRGQLPTPGIAADPAWWRGFGDPVLTDLVEEALRANSDIAIATTRVMQARAAFRIARGQQAPQINADGGGGRTRSVNAFGQAVEQWAGQGEVQVSFDTDLFGRLARASDAARAQLLASDYNRDSVRLAVAASMASGYIALRSYDARLDVLRRTLEIRAAALKLARRRAEAGYASQLDYAQAEAEYQAALQLIPPAELAVTRQENALSLLLGRTPDTIARGSKLDALTLPDIPLELPAAVVRQRPDLAAAEAQIVAAYRSLDSARAAFLPDIRLTAAGGVVASSLLSDPLSVFSLGGSILAPIFNGGRLRAQADAAAARRDEAAFAYRRAVLTAFREVEDGLAARQRLAEQEIGIAGQREALTRAQQLAWNRYHEGYSPFLELLDAQRALLSAELAAVQVRSDRLTASVGLFQAFGIRPE